MIIITGASRGIGRMLAEHYLQNGEPVRGSYLTTPPSAAGDHLTLVDVSDFTAVDAWISEACQDQSQITLINCAGINYSAFAHKADTARWEQVIRVNLLGAFNTMRAVLPAMRAAGFGRVINFSSVVPQLGVPGTSAYAASKSGLWGMTKSIANENAKCGVTANCINLGYFDIGMIEEVSEDVRDVVRGRIPTGRFGSPEEIVRCVEYVRSAEYLTGTEIDLNGGLR